MTKGADHDQQSSPPERPPNTWEAEDDFKERVKILGNLAEASMDEAHALQEKLNEEGKGQWHGDNPPKPVDQLFNFTILIVFLLIVAVGAFYFTTGSDLLTGLREDPPASDPEIDAPGESSDAITRDELETQDPIAITAYPWIFIRNEGQGNSFYAIYFEPEGACSIPGNTSVYDCAYTVNEANVEIEIYRTVTAEYSNKDAGSQVIDWKEWFHLTRIGNAMRGSYEIESWFFDPNKGLEWRGNQIISDTVFAYPEHQEDPG